MPSNSHPVDFETGACDGIVGVEDHLCPELHHHQKEGNHNEKGGNGQSVISLSKQMQVRSSGDFFFADKDGKMHGSAG